MSDVFISYKAEDRARVRPLVEALEADGLSVWWDAHIGGGDEWRETIARHLDEARCVIVVWSKRSVGPEGRFVRDEATRALRRHAYLPVRIDKVEPPLGFGETQALPLNGWKGDRADPRYVAVANAVRSITGLEPHSEVLPGPASISRRPLLIGGGAAAVAAAIGGWVLLKPAAAKANSIAVLPFANLSGDPAQAYFSDGLAEELRSALSRIAGLKVVARTSSEVVRNADAKTAARKLQVENIVAGSVRRSSAMIRVNAQLIGEDGLERWSETLDRPAGDLLEIQTNIAENVATALMVELAGNDRTALGLGGTDNAAAQDLFLRARFVRQVDSERTLEESLGLLQAAIALDPRFAQAYSDKAFVLRFLAATYALSPEEAQEGYRQAKEAIQRAIALEPRLAPAYATRADIYRDQLDMGRAFADFKRADALPGDDAAVLRRYGIMLSIARRFEEAGRKIDQAKTLDPLNPLSFESEALFLGYSRDYAGAAAAARRSLQLEPGRQQSRRHLATALLLQGKIEEAKAEFQRMDPDDYRRQLGEALIAQRQGNRAGALATLEKMKGRYAEAALYQYAQIYAQLGMVNEALATLQRAYETRDPGMPYLLVDPFLDPLRKDPRFAAIEAKLNFPQS